MGLAQLIWGPRAGLGCREENFSPRQSPHELLQAQEPQKEEYPPRAGILGSSTHWQLWEGVGSDCKPISAALAAPRAQWLQLLPASHPCLDRAQSTLRQWKVSWGRGCDGMSFQVPPNPNHTLIFGCSVLLKWQSRGRAAQEPPAPPWSRQHRVAPTPCCPDSRMGTSWGHLRDILGTGWCCTGATTSPQPSPGAVSVSPSQEFGTDFHQGLPWRGNNPSKRMPGHRNTLRSLHSSCYRAGQGLAPRGAKILKIFK